MSVHSRELFSIRERRSLAVSFFGSDGNRNSHVSCIFEMISE